MTKIEFFFSGFAVEHSAEQYVKSHSIDDIIGDNKTSKVCTIL